MNVSPIGRKKIAHAFPRSTQCSQQKRINDLESVTLPLNSGEGESRPCWLSCIDAALSVKVIAVHQPSPL